MIWTRNYDAHVATEGGYEIEITPTYTLPPTRIPKAEKYIMSMYGPWAIHRTFPTITAAKDAAERMIAALREMEDA